MDVNTIEEDNKDVNDMVHAGKFGRWTEVFPVLDKKPNLINCIPEMRAWAVLHQAVYWEDAATVTRLLAYDTCDSLVKTRKSLDGNIPEGSTAAEIAKSLNLSNIKSLIDQNTTAYRKQRFASDISYFVSRKHGQKIRDRGFPLFLYEIVMYKESLVGGQQNVKGNMTELMEKIFNRESQTWEETENNVLLALYAIDKNAANELKRNLSTETEFFEKLISLYTGNLLYSKVNKALGREFEESYQPSGFDLGIGIYGFLLDLVLCFWSEAKQVNKTTYRGISFDVTEKYKIDQEIMFTTLVSSSESKNVAQGFRGENGTLFIMNNNAASTMRPRDISMYSDFPSEKECLYALGAEFKVIKVDLLNKTVELELLA